ncbi:MAG TPA: hypothetical protein VK034_06675 [Enhygromyxa sp.]|nr:hypothetical protein [Enhygromyxa sp.]
MGHYYKKWTPPDGNCFFHALRDLLVARGTDDPVPSATEIRKTIAGVVARTVFGVGYDDLVGEILARRELNLVDGVRESDMWSTIKDALNSHLHRADGQRVETLRASQAAVFIALLGKDTRTDLHQFEPAAKRRNIGPAASTLVWADADEGDFGGVRASGVVLEAAVQAYDLDNLRIVTPPPRDRLGQVASVFDLTEPDTDHVFLYHGGDHFQALLWSDEVRPVPAPRQEIGGREGSVSAPVSLKVARQLTNTLAGSVLFGAVTWNFNHLGEQATSYLLEALGSKPKSSKRTVRSSGSEAGAKKLASKLLALEALIRNNSDWIDVIALQEVNQGIDYLAENTLWYYGKEYPLKCIEGADLYTCYRGPMFQSIAASANTSTGQKEYYPLLVPNHRPKSRPPLEYRGWTAVFADRDELDEGNAKSKQTLYWTKRSVYQKLNRKKKRAIDKHVDGRFYRPVLVHRLVLGEQRINVAVVHTTPSGTELNRTEVFFQVDDFFQRVASRDLDRAKKGERPDLWVVTGDYYLFGEAAVFSEKQIRGKDPIMQARIEKYLADTKDEYQALRKALKPPRSKGAYGVKRKFDAISSESIPNDQRVVIPHALRAEQSVWVYESSDARAPYVEALEEVLAGLNKLGGQTPGKAIPQILAFERRLLNAIPKVAPSKRFRKGTDGEEESDGSDSDLSDSDVDDDPDTDEDDEDAKLTGAGYYARSQQGARSPFVRLRNVLGYSFAERIRGSFQILQPPAATNVHASADLDKPEDDPSLVGTWGQDQSKDQTAFRIADFFVVDRRWASHEAGLMVDEDGGGLVWMDDEVSSQSERWRQISDHFPMAVRLSTAPHDGRVERALRSDKRAVREMAKLYEDVAEEDLQALKRRTRQEDWLTGDEDTRRHILEQLRDGEDSS